MNNFNEVLQSWLDKAKDGNFVTEANLGSFMES